MSGGFGCAGGLRIYKISILEINFILPKILGKTKYIIKIYLFITITKYIIMKSQFLGKRGNNQ